MAAYVDLFALKNNSVLQDRILVAVAVAAEMIRTDESPPANEDQRLAWAGQAMLDPKAEAQRMLWAVLAANKDATTAQILDADDATLQSKVDDAVDLFAGGNHGQ